MTSYIILSGGPLGGTIVPVKDAVADCDGVPGTIIEEATSEASIDSKGQAVLVSAPCTYRVCSLQTRIVNGQPQSSGQATYCGIG